MAQQTKAKKVRKNTIKTAYRYHIYLIDNQLKYEAFASEITELLHLQPDPSLQPKTKVLREEDYDALIDFATQQPLAYAFENSFTAWKTTDRLLFLYLAKEDKVLPYEIRLGGMLLVDFQPILEAYNALVLL